MREIAITKEIRTIILAKTLQYVTNRDDAEDIVQEVLTELYKQRDRIVPEAAISWSLKVARNKSFKFLKKQKKTIPLDFEVEEPKLTTYLIDSLENNDKKTKVDNFKIGSLKDLPARDRKLLQYYAETGKNFIKLARKRRTKYETVRKQIYRLKSEVYAKYFRNLGMIGSQKMIDSHLHESITYFIKRLNVCMMNNEMYKLKRYFGKEINRNMLPDIKIKRIVHYDIILRDDNQYRVLVFFRNTDDDFNGYSLEFTETNKHKPICITKLPKAPGKIRGYKESNLSKEDSTKILAVDKTKGTLLLNNTEREEILKKYTPDRIIENK
jgi:RNA polymerase sigma factor (sigma-70 family)